MNTFLLPDLGEGLTEAEIVRWLVQVGDVVAVDTPIAEVETAKSIVELPSPYAGVIEELHGEPGTTVPVGKPLITVGDPAGAAYRSEERAGSGNVLVGYGTAESPATGRRRKPRASGSGSVPESASAVRVPLVISPLVRRMARDAGVDLHELRGSGPDGLIVRRDVEHAIAFRTQQHPTPEQQLAGQQPAGLRSGAPEQFAAQQPAGQQGGAQQQSSAQEQLAAEQQFTAQQQPAGQQFAGQQFAGQQFAGEQQPVGEQAAVQRQPAGVQSGAQQSAAQAAAVGVVEGRTGLRELRRVPMSGFRKAVAATLSRSRAEIPEATTWVDVDATALVELRASLRSATDPGPGLLALMARFVVAGLLKYPELNGYVDTAREELVQYDGVNLGLAAQTDRGLVVPAVGNAHTLTTRGLDAEIRRLTASAREGRLTQHELTSGTFTLNNYGSFGVDGSAAIINHPQVAILGVGRIIDRPWVVDGEIAVRKLTQLSLVFDHRVCDGGTAAAFLRFVADAFENPASVFADL